MPIFSTTGALPHDLWLVDGSPAFSTLPANTVAGLVIDLPIWLKVGTKAYGVAHIEHRHAQWVQKSGMAVPELVYAKLGQHGAVYTTERDVKFKLSMRLTPDALLILDLFSHAAIPHLSVTSMYASPGTLDGTRVGKYRGR